VSASISSKPEQVPEQRDVPKLPVPNQVITVTEAEFC